MKRAREAAAKTASNDAKKTPSAMKKARAAARVETILDGWSKTASNDAKKAMQPPTDPALGKPMTKQAAAPEVILIDDDVEFHPGVNLSIDVDVVASQGARSSPLPAVGDKTENEGTARPKDSTIPPNTNDVDDTELTEDPDAALTDHSDADTADLATAKAAAVDGADSLVLQGASAALPPPLAAVAGDEIGPYEDVSVVRAHGEQCSFFHGTISVPEAINVLRKLKTKGRLRPNRKAPTAQKLDAQLTQAQPFLVRQIGRNKIMLVHPIKKKKQYITSETRLIYRPGAGWCLIHHTTPPGEVSQTEAGRAYMESWQHERTKPTLAALTNWLRQKGAGSKKWKGLGLSVNRTSCRKHEYPADGTIDSFFCTARPDDPLGSEATAVKAAIQPSDIGVNLGSGESGAVADAAPAVGPSTKRMTTPNNDGPPMTATEQSFGCSAPSRATRDRQPARTPALALAPPRIEPNDDGPPSSKVKVTNPSPPARPPGQLQRPPTSSSDLRNTMSKKRTMAQLEADAYKRLILISWEREEAEVAMLSTPAELDVVRAHVSTSTGRWEPLATEADILSEMTDKHIGPSVVIEGPNLKASEVQQLVIQGIRDGLLVSIHRVEMRLADGEGQSSFVELPPKFGIDDVLCLYGESTALVGCGKCGEQATVATSKLLRCSACKIQKYCSKECQVQDWHWHKSSCTTSRETLAISRDPTVSPITRLVDLKRSPFWQGSVSSAATRRINNFQNEVVDVHNKIRVLARRLSSVRKNREVDRAIAGVGSDYIPFAWPADDDDDSAATADVAALGARAGAGHGKDAGIPRRDVGDGGGGGGGGGRGAAAAHRSQMAGKRSVGTVDFGVAPSASLCCGGQTHDWTKIRPVLAPLNVAPAAKKRRLQDATPSEAPAASRATLRTGGRAARDTRR